MTDFDLLEGDGGRLFLKIFTGRTHYMVELESGDVDDLRSTLHESTRVERQ